MAFKNVNARNLINSLILQHYRRTGILVFPSLTGVWDTGRYWASGQERVVRVKGTKNCVQEGQVYMAEKIIFLLKDFFQ